MNTSRGTFPKPADRLEWLRLRHPFFNASAAAVLFDRHPFLSPSAYTRTKLTGEEQVENEAMLRGRMLEDALAQWWAHRHNVHDVWEPAVLFFAGRVMATVDRMAGPGVPIEVKTTNRFTGAEPEEHWLDQCQAIMLCTEAPGMWLVWMDASLELREVEVVADEAWQAAIRVGAERFMGFIDLGMVPEGVTLSYSDAGRVYPEVELAKCVLDVDAKSAVELYRAARHHRLKWQAQEKVAQGIVATAMGSAELGLWNDEPVVEWKATKPRRVLDMGALRERLGEELDEFYSEVPQRRMRVLGDDDEEAEDG